MNIARITTWVVAFLCTAAAFAQPAATRTEDPKTDRWERDIRRFEAQDQKQPPPQDGILFLGSSTMVLWDLKKSFPGLPVINRGFGGSQYADSARYADRIAIPYRPKVAVLYAGDNDIARGKSPAQVLADFEQLRTKLQKALPEVKIVVLGIKPSVARWSLVEKMREANRLIRESVAGDKRIVFIDTDRPMLAPDGKPRADLLRKDGLHLNDAGYRLWSSLVRPHLNLAK